MKFHLRALSVAVLAAPLAGCATYDLIKPPPAQSQPIAIAFSNEGPSGWTDLPIGTYRIPGRTVIVSGQQKGGGIGMMFGLVGVLAESAVSTAGEKRAVNGAESELRLDLAPEANGLAQQALASGRYGQTFAALVDPNGLTLEVAPYTVLTFETDTAVRPAVILKATLKSPVDGQLWMSRYIAISGAALPLSGGNGLTADSGRLLKTAVSLDLQRAMGAMLDDVATRRGRDGNVQVYVETAMPFVRPRFGLTGTELSDDNGALVLVSKIADANVFAGVLIFDDAATLHRPATADDKIHVLDEK